MWCDELRNSLGRDPESINEERLQSIDVVDAATQRSNTLICINPHEQDVEARQWRGAGFMGAFRQHLIVY